MKPVLTQALLVPQSNAPRPALPRSPAHVLVNCALLTTAIRRNHSRFSNVHVHHRTSALAGTKKFRLRPSARYLERSPRTSHWQHHILRSYERTAFRRCLPECCRDGHVCPSQGRNGDVRHTRNHRCHWVADPFCEEPRCCCRDLYREEMVGKKYGTEAMTWLVDHAFLELGMHRVSLQVFGENERGVRLYEKLGFKVEGTRRKCNWRNGHWEDIIDMAILDEEFEAIHGGAGDR
ncbi:acyl-CoA N-acyltransferase [Hymenopellis radicata]|nr:acyl-CoA N-acyltransferase [Hymenopellis radicata]